MGVDTKAVIRKNVTVDKLVSHIQKKFGKVEIHSTFNEDYFVLIFSDNKDTRQMNVFLNDYAKNDYGIDGILLSLGCWGNSVAIMEYICEEFGGYVMDNDSVGDFRPVREDLFFTEQLLTELEKFRQKFFFMAIKKEINYDEMMKLLDEHESLIRKSN